MAAKKKSIAIPWKQALAQAAKSGKAPKEKPSVGNKIKLMKSGKFSMGGKVLGSELDVVIISFLFQKAWYDRDFDPDNVCPPACAALAYDEDEMEPLKESPVKQCDSCASCDFNEFGSATKGTGAGKECADHRRLAVVAFDKKGVVEGIKRIDVPPTSLGNWRGFVGEVEDNGLEPMQCVVRLSFEEDSTATQPPLEFEFVKEIKTGKTLQELANLIPQAQKVIEQPYDFSKYEKPSKKKAKGKKKAKKKSKFS